MCSCNREFPIDRSTSCVFSFRSTLQKRSTQYVLEKSSLRNHREKKKKRNNLLAVLIIERIFSISIRNRNREKFPIEIYIEAFKVCKLKLKSKFNCLKRYIILRLLSKVFAEKKIISNRRSIDFSLSTSDLGDE